MWVLILQQSGKQASYWALRLFENSLLSELGYGLDFEPATPLYFQLENRNALRGVLTGVVFGFFVIFTTHLSLVRTVRKSKGQSRKDNPETWATLGGNNTQKEDKQNYIK